MRQRWLSLLDAALGRAGRLLCLLGRHGATRAARHDHIRPDGGVVGGR